MDEEHEIVVTSSYIQFKEFVESSVWADIINEFGIWVDQQRVFQDTEESLVTLYKCQGRVEAIKYAMGLPSVIVEAFEDRMEERDNGGAE